MSLQIASPGSKSHMQLARMETKAARSSFWNKLLIDDSKGRIVNSSDITNAAAGALHYDDHKRMLDDVVMARKFMPTAFDSLSAVPGVVVPVSLSDTLVGYQNMNEFDAQTSMNGSNRNSNQSDYKYAWVPQPIYHCDFHIPFRQNSFAYKSSDGATEAVMQVALERDKTLMLGNSSIAVEVNGVMAQLYGLTNHPATLALPGGISDWALTANVNVITPEAVQLISQLYANRTAAQIPNSIIMFVANDVYTNLENDYSDAKGDRTVHERLKAISQIRDVMPSQWLPDGAVLLVEASPQTMRIPTSNDVIVTPWSRVDPMEDLKFTTMAASTLQVRSDRNDKTGLLYATK